MTGPASDLAEVAADLAPAGRLRVALNHGNLVLVRRGPTDDAPTGVTVDLARAMSDRLGLALEFIHFDRAADVSASAAAGVWDLCFLAVDPGRSAGIEFSEPYVAIDGAYLLPEDAGIHDIADVDRLGLRVGAVRGSAYALHLERAARGLRLVIFETSREAAQALAERRVDCLGGVRQAMDRLAEQLPAHRVLEEPFMSILQAVGVPKGRPGAAAFVRRFVNDARASGFVSDALARSGQADVRVP